MVKEEILTFGSKRYMTTLNKYGKEDVIDQVRDHCLCEVKEGTINKTYIVVTDKYLICTGAFVVAFDDLELYDLSRYDSYRVFNITAFDNEGNVYTKRLGLLKPEDAQKIQDAVYPKLLSARKGLTPENYFDYKRTYADKLLLRAKEAMADKKFKTFQRGYLRGNPAHIYTFLLCGVGLLYLLRLMDAKTPLQAGATVFVALFLMAGGLIPFFVKNKTYKAYKAFIKENEEEVLDQINNRVIYAPYINEGNARAFVTEKYLVLIGEAVIRRDDVVWISGYLHKGTWNLTAWDNNGTKYILPMGGDFYDWMQDELMVSSLLPNSIVFTNIDNTKYIEERYKR